MLLSELMRASADATASPAALPRDPVLSGLTLDSRKVKPGFLFAALVLTISVVSFPLLLDRHVGVSTAVVTSVRAVLDNPGPMAAWGLVVAAGLVIGAIPLLLGYAIVIPVLGHATWHLYRKAVPRDPIK